MAQGPTLIEAGEALEDKRTALRLGQAAFARQLGLSRSSYLRRIRGDQPFTATEMVIARRKYGIDLLALLS